MFGSIETTKQHSLLDLDGHVESGHFESKRKNMLKTAHEDALKVSDDGGEVVQLGVESLNNVRYVIEGEFCRRQVDCSPQISVEQANSSLKKRPLEI